MGYNSYVKASIDHNSILYEISKSFLFAEYGYM